jgi:hypothetical protein
MGVLVGDKELVTNELDTTVVLAICEVRNLVLKPNVNYRFEVMEGCESCRLAAEEI